MGACVLGAVFYKWACFQSQKLTELKIKKGHVSSDQVCRRFWRPKSEYIARSLERLTGKLWFDILDMYVGFCETRMPYALPYPFKLLQHGPLTSTACHCALLWSLFHEAAEFSFQRPLTSQRTILLVRDSSNLFDITSWLKLKHSETLENDFVDLEKTVIANISTLNVIISL